MESTKEMKNIKPAYAVRLGTGVFAGADWQCKYCGYIAKGYSYQPSPSTGGSCPESNSGKHAFFQM